MTLPSLKDFIRRSQVIDMYRSFLRKSKRIEDDILRGNIREELKTQFRLNSHLRDPMAIKSCILEAHRNLQKIDSIIAVSSLGIPTQSQPRARTNGLLDTETDKRLGIDWPWEK